MNRVSLQALTWGTVSAAIVSAMLLAAAGDEAAEWRLEPPTAGKPTRLQSQPQDQPLGAPAGSAPAGDRH